LKQGTPSDAKVSSLVGSLDAVYAKGVYLTLTTSPPPMAHQIGYDRTPICADLDELGDNIVALPDRFPSFELPLDPSLLSQLRCGDAPPVDVALGFEHDAEHAFTDLADGALQGSDIAAGEVSEALITQMPFTDDTTVARVVLGAGATAA